jgi:hypothetical protein
MEGPWLAVPCAREPEIRPTEESLVKKGRHRRFEEARSLKRSVATDNGRCAECGADPEDEHASWCLVESDKFEDILGTRLSDGHDREDDPLAD